MAPIKNDKLVAPWTKSQVDTLNAYQRNKYFHPYTCSNRGDSEHKFANGDYGVLVATENGWVCPDCGYTQDWAHAGSLDVAYLEFMDKDWRHA